MGFRFQISSSYGSLIPRSPILTRYPRSNPLLEMYLDKYVLVLYEADLTTLRNMRPGIETIGAMNGSGMVLCLPRNFEACIRIGAA